MKYVLRLFLPIVPLLLAGCEILALPFYLPIAGTVELQYKAYEAEHEESFSICAENVIGNEEYVLKCSESAAEATTVAKLNKLRRYIVRWGYSSGGVNYYSEFVRPANDYTRPLVTAKLEEINHSTVTHLDKSGSCRYAGNQTGFINVISTHGDNYRGVRFFFYDECRTSGTGAWVDPAYPAIVFQWDYLWDKPNWDIEVRAYHSSIGYQPLSEEADQVEETIVNRILDEFEALLKG